MEELLNAEEVRYPVVTRERVGGNDPHVNCLLTWADGKSVSIREESFSYAGIVSALVNAEYDSNRMQAVQNNYLLDMDEHRAEFDAMQRWRAEAKRIAKEVLGDGVQEK